KRRVVSRIRAFVPQIRPGNDPGVTVADLEGLASKAWQCDEFNLAHALLDRWAERTPKNPRLLRLRAAVYASAGSYVQAIEAAKAAMEQNPREQEIRSNLETILRWAPQRLQDQARQFAPTRPGP